jgi:hypothetical protein
MSDPQVDPALQERLERMQGVLHGRSESQAGPVALGERLVLPYDSEAMLEWLVLAVTRRGVVLVPLFDEEGQGGKDVVVRVPPMGARVHARVGALVEVPRTAANASRRLRPVEAFYVGKVRARVEGLGPSEGEDPEEAVRLVAAWGGACLSPTTAVSSWSGEAVTPLWRRPVARLAAGLAVAMGLALMTLPVFEGSGPVRARPGVYALRGAGEVGVELSLAGVPCLAEGVPGAAPCPTLGDQQVTLRYRRDPGVGLEHLLVVAEVEGRYEVVAAGDLPPTVDPEGRERCAEGLCPVDGVGALPSRPGRVDAFLSERPLGLADVVAEGGPPAPPAGVIVYTFMLRGR